MVKVLILGGTRDAVNLAIAASALPGTDVIYSLAGVTQNPNLPGCAVRSGGFGGLEGLKAYLIDAEIDMVIDATHPFAAEIAANVFAACRGTGLPRLKFLRPPWVPQSGDNWIEVGLVADAVSYLRDHSSTVFLTIGTREIAAFACLENCRFLVRYIHPPKDGVPLKNCEVVVDRGPFLEPGETELLRSNGVQYLVSKNSGGDGAAAKLAAARRLGIPVIMINRPAPPAGGIAEAQEDAIAWLQKL
ncbi:MAG: cobalt-precorrin-6A reductase [Rhodospirillaceae bacterium]|nr:cobalt-precorrin-6A reductase [Rhodospirillaceae bacterium]